MTEDIGRLIRWCGVPAIVFAIVAAVYLGRGFEFAENPLIDLRMSSQVRAADPGITVVAIDPESLAELGAWPWPRAHHARVIERLYALGAESVAVDIDLSTPGDAADDSVLAETLARFRDTTVLAAFTQARAPGSGATDRLLNQPLDIFRATSEVAGAVLTAVSTTVVSFLPVFTMTAAEQFGDGFALGLTANIPKCDVRSADGVNGRSSSSVAIGFVVHFFPQPFDIERILAEEDRRQSVSSGGGPWSIKAGLANVRLAGNFADSRDSHVRMNLDYQYVQRSIGNSFNVGHA